MEKMICLIALLAISCNSFAMDEVPAESTPTTKLYLLPTDTVLSERLAEKGFMDFNAKAEFSGLWADSEVSVHSAAIAIDMGIVYYAKALAVAAATDRASIDYTKALTEDELAPLRAQLKPVWDGKQTLLNALLQDHPEALEELKTFTYEFPRSSSLRIEGSSQNDTKN